MREIFFDNLNNFQWSSIAAIASILALVTSILSIYVTKIENNKNRKSTTHVKLRIEELKEIREIAMELDSKINSYINQRSKEIGVKSVSTTDTIVIILDSYLNKLQAMLYRESKHVSDFSIVISLNQLRLLNPKNTIQLTEISISMKKAINEYSRQELLEIEKHI